MRGREGENGTTSEEEKKSVREIEGERARVREEAGDRGETE